MSSYSGLHSLRWICGECSSTTDQTQNQSSLEESSVKLTNNWKRFKLELKSSRQLLFYKLAGGRTVTPASCFHQMSLSCVLGAAGAQNLEQACSGDSHQMHTVGSHGRTEDGGRRQLVGSQRLPASADHASLSTNSSLKVWGSNQWCPTFYGSHDLHILYKQPAQVHSKEQRANFLKCHFSLDSLC